ncbi:uncharacterized protein znf106b isoform X2 [Carassius auratus]|uniref:Uncharacterized protein znf106b isoform X2 n=1 Tax=Carassius auratus TaxID=7957 RepID=A0A6P6RPF8_CARAU|nr:uncharacterized protein LOC113120961 isoform X2 [Carassius auratus]
MEITANNELKVIDKHMHSYFHHEAIEKIKGSLQLHKCWACDVSVMGLEQYKEHIATEMHKQNLFKLQDKRHKREHFKADYNIDLKDTEIKALFDPRPQGRKKKKDLDRCSICHHRFPEQDWDKHMHSFIHHQTVEQLKGSEQEHKCWACEMTVKGMAAFKKHISTEHHKRKLSDLTKNRKLGKYTLDYSVEFNELKDLCAQRDQEKFMKKREKMGKWKAKRKTMKLIQIRSTAGNEHCTTPFMVNQEFEAGQFPPSCHFMFFWENQNDHPAAIQHNQNLPTQRQESILDMDRSDGPLVKSLERPSENIPQEMSAHGTHPNCDGKSTDVCVNHVTPGTECGVAADPTCAPELVQSRMEANIPNLTAARGVCLTQEEAAGNEAVVLNPPQHASSKKSMLKVNGAGSQSEQGMTRECMSGKEPYTDSFLPVSVPAEMFKSQASENELEIIENVRPHTAHIQKKRSNECETEQGETSLEHHSSFEDTSCNVQKTKRKKQDDSNSDLNPEINNKISRKRKVNKLISLSMKEEELNSSLENVGEQLFQAYSTLQNAFTEVQRLLAVKQEVTSEMASLRAKRIKILQDMKNPSDQQEVLNES